MVGEVLLHNVSDLPRRYLFRKTKERGCVSFSIQARKKVVDTFVIRNTSDECGAHRAGCRVLYPAIELISTPEASMSQAEM